MKSNVWRKLFDGMNLLLGNIAYQIRYDKDMVRRWETMGQINHYENLIYIDPDLHERDMLATILHELIECINRQQEIGLPHSVIVGLETGLMGVMMNNPDLFQIFVDEAYRDPFENVGEREGEEEEEKEEITTA